MVKLDIISGFLGAGKTTFIKKVFNEYKDGKEKIVLIENEFGEIDIDSDIMRINGYDVYELRNGCVCCTLRLDFMDTMKDILKYEPDRIIFEPSGVFMPSEIFTLFNSDDIRSKCRLNSITTVVDGVNFLRQKGIFSSFFEDQIKNASSLLISKSQLINEGQLSETITELRGLNPEAEILARNWDNMVGNDIRLMIDYNTKYALNNAIDMIIEDTSKDASNHKEHYNIRSAGFKCSRTFTRGKLEDMLKKLSDNKYGDIMRAKGFLRSEKGYYEFSYVNGEFDIIERSGETSGKVCFIGIMLKKMELLSLLKI